MLSVDEAKRLAAVEEKCRDIDAALRRLKSEVAVSVDEKLSAAFRHMERIVSDGLLTIAKDVKDIRSSQDTSLGLMQEAAEERGRRKQREEELALRGKGGVLDKSDADVEAMRALTVANRWKGKALAIAIVLGAFGGLITAVLTSHGH